MMKKTAKAMIKKMMKIETKIKNNKNKNRIIIIAKIKKIMLIKIKMNRKI